MRTSPVITRFTFESRILAKIASFAGTCACPRLVFTSVFFHEIRPAVQDRVRRVMAEIEKKGLVLIPFNKLHRLAVQPIGQILALAQLVLRQINPRDRLRAEHVREKVGAIAHALHFAARIPAKAMIRRSQFKLRLVVLITRQMPFTHHARAILVLPKNLRQGHLAHRQRVGGIGPEIIRNAYPRRVLPRKQRSTVRRTHRCCRVRMREPHALLCQAIQIRRLVKLVPVTPQLRPTKIVRQHKHNIRSANLRRGIKRQPAQ